MVIEKLMGIDGQVYDISLLGRLLWFTITETRITREELEGVFERAGIDQKWLPFPISHRDAFRRATKTMELNREELAGGGRYLNLLVREVKCSPDQVVRQLVREIVDSKNVRLEYKPIFSLELNGESLEVKELVDLIELSRLEHEMVQRLARRYEADKMNYNGRHVREIVQRILHGCNPVSVRPSGGVYFVPQKHAETVDGLQRMVKELSGYSATSWKSSMHSMPVVDTEEQRAMVHESLEDQVKAASKALIDEMAGLIHQAEQGKKVTGTTIDNYLGRVQELKAMIAEYQEMLEVEVIGAAANLELARKQAMKLLDLEAVA
ncbi:MAG: hypothetical protein C4570_07805 [Ammonifex sp.]|jgi:predicted RNase H-related nuclease YkuK (DUF458 family)|nr:MAG: hypothetical protein C4570_07805 [Ammonifex sp.]